MQLILIIFILVPIIEIAVFFQVGSFLGLTTTLVIVLLTAILGVHLLKQQGLRAWTDIQLKMAQGQLPALEMAAAVQLLFAGGLLLTPGFVTDAVGFSLMFPAVRMFVAKQILRGWSAKMTGQFSRSEFNQAPAKSQPFHAEKTVYSTKQKITEHRIIEGEFEKQSPKKSENSDN